MDLDRFPHSAKTRNLVRFGWHPPHETLDESFIADFSFRAKQSRFSILKSPGTAPGPDQCFRFTEAPAGVLRDTPCHARYPAEDTPLRSTRSTR